MIMRSPIIADAAVETRRVFSYIAVAVALFGCGDGGGDDEKNTEKSGKKSDSTPKIDTSTLKGKYAEHFSMGAAVDWSSYETYDEILREHFNSITCENEMKFLSLQRHQDRFTFNQADEIVDFAVDNDIAVRGHALVWHRQTPSWVFKDDDGVPVSEEVLFERLEKHITTVMDHFKGRVYAWDVVNEAIVNDGSFRTGEENRDDQKSQWYAISEERYIAEAFRYARGADPDTKLFYNDYYNYVPDRYEAIYELLKSLKDEDLVDGVGLQAHFKIDSSSNSLDINHYQTVEYLEKAIERYASLGLEIQITEMDVSVYRPDFFYQEEDFYTEETFTEEIEEQQAERYADFFELFRQHSDAITNVTLWGVADDNTWLSEFDSGRQDFPLLFNLDHEPKMAFDAVMDF